MNPAEQPAPHPVASKTPAAQPVRFVEVWTWLCALAALAGWGLSAIGQLNRIGYLCFFAVAAAIFFAFNRRRLPSLCFGRLARRFRRPLPSAFAFLGLLVFCGSIWYPPTNYTGLNYHLARVLQWLSHGHWFWIHTSVIRMNYSGCAFEWLTTPLILFTNSDRALFLVNFIPFLLLPGLVFSAFTRLGVNARVAWYWMWLLPASYNLLLQAGSIDNDAFGAVFALAAIDFGCRAWSTRRVQDIWLSMLAIALLTGTKPVSLPLLLPWTILIVPLLPLLRRQWLATVPVAILAAVASFLTLALINQHYTGDWLARTIEPFHKEIHQPLIGIFGNAFQFALGNLLPPIMPWAGWWNANALATLPHAVVVALNGNFEPGYLIIGEIPTEDTTGVGFGVSWLLIISLAACWCIRKQGPVVRVAGAVPSWLGRCVMAAAWIALLAYCMKGGMNTAARLVCAFYLPLMPAILVLAGQSEIVRRCWWRLLAGATMALALLVLVLSPDRPLWPAQTILSKVLQNHPAQRSAARAFEVYSLYSKRNDPLAPVRQLLPPGIDVVGFIGDGDDPDISLWKPFGSRRVEHFLIDDPPEYFRSRVHCVVVAGSVLAVNQMSIGDWLQKNDAELLATTNATIKINQGSQNWYVTRLKP